MNYDQGSEILKALGHPVRLKIVEGLMRNKCNVGGIVEKFNLPQSTISQHLGVLRAQGIIIPEKDGVKTCYKVVNHKVKEIIKILQ